MTVEERSSETVRQQRVQWSSDGEGGPEPGDDGGMGDCMSVSECTGGGNKREVSWTASSIFLLFFFFWLYLGLHCCVGFSLIVVSWGYSSCSAWASHCSGLYDGLSCCRAQALGQSSAIVVAHGLYSCSSQALENRLNSYGAWACSSACGMFPDQELNLCFLHWLVDSLPLSHQESP